MKRKTFSKVSPSKDDIIDENVEYSAKLGLKDTDRQTIGSTNYVRKMQNVDARFVVWGTRFGNGNQCQINIVVYFFYVLDHF